MRKRPRSPARELCPRPLLPLFRFEKGGTSSTPSAGRAFPDLRFPKQREAPVRQHECDQRLDDKLDDARDHIGVHRRAGRGDDAGEREEREDGPLAFKRNARREAILLSPSQPAQGSKRGFENQLGRCSKLMKVSFRRPKNGTLPTALPSRIHYQRRCFIACSKPCQFHERTS
jgi:hypothetical protein